MRVEHIGDARLILGDCREVLPTLGRFDALVTDPPYGIGADKGAGKSAEKWSAFTGEARWDESAPQELAVEAISMARVAVVWGGNYFNLPPTPCLLVWDKETAGVTTFADCEVAWTNLKSAIRLKRHLWSGPYMKVREERVHPTQKPLGVMLWCIDQLPKDTETVFDPFMGSGTTGVACAESRKAFTGIEREPRYFDIACKRIEDAQRQGKLFGDAA